MKHQFLIGCISMIMPAMVYAEIPYVGVDVHGVDYKAGSDHVHDVLVGVRVGTYLSKNFGVETRLSKGFQNAQYEINGTKEDVTVEYRAEAFLKMHNLSSDGLEIFALFGGGYTRYRFPDYDSHQSSGTLGLGGGANLYITPNTMAGMDIILQNKGQFAFSMGLKYRLK